MRYRITNLLVTEQQSHRIFTFNLGSAQIIDLCRVERFWDDVTTGVNRELNHDQVAGIALAMSAKNTTNTLWLEPIIVALIGNWQFDEENRILFTDDPEAYCSVDDGQHRVEALKSGLLTTEEIAGLNFNITATKDLPYNLRLRIFRMQAERRPINRRLDLAQRNKLGEWRSETDQEAYRLVLDLNNDHRSPLNNKVYLKEGVPSGAIDLISANGLHSTIKMLFGRRSPLHGCLPAKRKEIVFSAIRIASETWPEAWNSPKHMLCSGRGINTILQLFVSGVNFRQAMGLETSIESISKAFGFARDFDWTVAKAKNEGTPHIISRLDEMIRRAIQKRSRSGSAPSSDKPPKS
jgi:hypothetical protein